MPTRLLDTLHWLWLGSISLAHAGVTARQFRLNNNNDLTSVTIPNSVTTIGVEAFYDNDVTSVAFFGDFGTFSLDMFEVSLDLATITYAQGATEWDAPLRIFTPRTGPTGSVTAEAAVPAATPVPTSPLWLLGIMAGLLSLVGIRKLRKA